MHELDAVLSQAPCYKDYEDVCSSGGAGTQILHESIALRSCRGHTEQKALWVLRTEGPLPLPGVEQQFTRTPLRSIKIYYND